MDECPKQLTGEVRTPLPCGKARTAKYDTEYARNGTGELFMFAAPRKAGGGLYQEKAGSARTGRVKYGVWLTLIFLTPKK
jgi:hypothetical protein